MAGDLDGLDLIPTDEAELSASDDLDAAAASAVADGRVAEAADEAPEPFGYSWAFDFEAGRFIRQGGAPARVTGFDALKQRCLMVLHAARYAHPIYSDDMGVESPEGLLGAAGEKARDAASDFEVSARDALLALDRVADVSLTVDYDPVQGVYLVSDLVVTTDEEVALPFADLRLTGGA